MFETLQMAPADAILGLTEAFKRDANPRKINLSVGVYQDASGKTPILAVVKEAEGRLLATETNKDYLGIDGIPEYGRHVGALMFGPAHDIITSRRAVTAQTPGGTGALRVAADFIKQKLGGRRIWCSKPTWPNHPSIFQAAGLEVDSYPYMDATSTALDFPQMLSALRKAQAGDAVCLHACCHNPSGIDLTGAQWRELGTVMRECRLLPLVDFAYQGFGDGLEEDAVGLRELAAACTEMLVCSSYSKNFGLYNERVGALTLVAESEQAAQVGLSHIKTCIRANYSNPPKHGAAIVATVLDDPALRGRWELELAAMRDRIAGMRRLFAEAMRARAVARDFSFITRQRGMFSFLGITPAQVETLRKDYAIYIVGSGRVNVAGMTEFNMDPLCDTLATVLR
ncbi:MAG: aspartate/tyrosine/aromatic aminotransferase [Planctomycetes bacterium]|nr:aspartate/tyrosine/aromatic aminotransferase [Planctomycetota bacterium]